MLVSLRRNRLTQTLHDNEEIAEGAVDLMEATYDAWSFNPSMAVGFSLNPHALALLEAAITRRRDR